MESPLITSIPLFAIFFGGVGVAERLQQRYPGEKLTFLQNFNTGAFAGFLSSVIVIPTDRVKCILQIQSDANAKNYNGTSDTLKKLYNEGGIRNIYRGTAATWLRGENPFLYIPVGFYISILLEIPSNGVKMAVYEYLKDRLSIDKSVETLSPIASLFAGGFAGMSQWLVCIPADVIKSNLQTAPAGRYPNGMRDVVHEILHNEGPKGFFRGFVPVMLRAFPANAAFFLGIELTLDVFRFCKE